MKQFIKNLFVKPNGDTRWTPYLILFIVVTSVGVAFLWNEIVYDFAHRFLRSGIWHIIGPVVGSLLVYKTVQGANDKTKTEWSQGKIAGFMFAGLLVFWFGLFAPSASLKADRSSNIPDVSIYYGNGKVKNATDSSKQDYYFKHVKLNSTDSLYVVTYGEEPGYNETNSAVRYGQYPKSDAPRANEEWSRPNLVEHVNNY